METDLTPEVRAKRVAVAKDVLMQLDREDVPLHLRIGIYLAGPGNLHGATSGPKEKRADHLQSHCEVCMLGAAFISYTRLFGSGPELVDGGSYYVAVSERIMRGAMADVFDRKTLALMESVFEKTNFSPSQADDEIDACERAAQWGRQFATPQAATRAICQNLIDNNGELLIPSQEPANA